MACIDYMIRSETKMQLKQLNTLLDCCCLIGICHGWPTIGVAQPPLWNLHKFKFVKYRRHQQTKYRKIWLLYKH